MKEECLQFLAIKPGAIYVDCTMGGGGHTKAILERGGKVIGLDQDPDAVKATSRLLEKFITDGQFEIIQINFRHIKKALQQSRIANGQPVDGILMDLGISSYQIDEASRGFSFGGDGPLDMRMHQGSIDSNLIGTDRALTAEKIVNEWNTEDIANILYHYGDETRSRIIAREIVANRPLNSTSSLVALISRLTSFKERPKTLARCFQALRIAVNDELGALEQALTDSCDCLKIGGRLVVISYHSLEDRRVKRLIRNGSIDPANLNISTNQDEDEDDGETNSSNVNNPWQAVFRRALKPTQVEIESNRRSRSARLRVAERINPYTTEVKQNKPKIGSKQLRKLEERKLIKS
jgi:16S rRNA (cytosine1402-N4)-methyltransferase